MQETTLFYEDVEIGTDLPPLNKRPTTRQLVKWAGVSGDFLEIHYDQNVAEKAGLPGVIVHGKLMISFLAEMLTTWVGLGGDLKLLSCSYRGIARPGQEICCKGRVTGKHIEQSQHYVDCQVWIENEEMVTIVQGRSKVVLPSRQNNESYLLEKRV